MSEEIHKITIDKIKGNSGIRCRFCNGECNLIKYHGYIAIGGFTLRVSLKCESCNEEQHFHYQISSEVANEGMVAGN